MTLIRWNPAADLFQIERTMDRMVDRFFSPDWFNGNHGSRWLPNMDVSEDTDSFIVNLELPGLDKDDVSIIFKDGVLTIEGERKQEKESKDTNYHRVERRYGKFRRSFSLPTLVKEDKIDAKFKEGILTITLPKAEEVKPRQIEVKVG